MYRTLPLLFVLTACELVGTPLEPVPTVACQDTLQRDAAVTVGQIVDHRFEALTQGSEVPVHSGAQGGYHSDLLVRVAGPESDAGINGGLSATIDLGTWAEERQLTYSPRCRGLGDAGYYAHVRVFWDDGEEGDDDDAAVDDWEDGDDWYVEDRFDYGEVVNHSADVHVSVAIGDGLETLVRDILLVEGEQESDEGGG